MEKGEVDSKEKEIVRLLDKKSKSRFGKYTKLVSVLMVLALGLGSGFLIAQLTIATGVVDKKVEVRELSSDDEITKGLVVGADDKSQFPDEAEGVLVEGGIDGEGTHYLERPGGISQNVYLTSSNVDLQKFVGRKVKVDGKTFAAEKAGWLMDVGQLEVLE
jgi:hypothetical protein